MNNLFIFTGILCIPSLSFFIFPFCFFHLLHSEIKLFLFPCPLSHCFSCHFPQNTLNCELCNTIFSADLSASLASLAWVSLIVLHHWLSLFYCSVPFVNICTWYPSLGLSNSLSSILLPSLNALASRNWIACPLNCSVSNYGIFNRLHDNVICQCTSLDL